MSTLRVLTLICLVMIAVGCTSGASTTPAMSSAKSDVTERRPVTTTKTTYTVPVAMPDGSTANVPPGTTVTQESTHDEGTVKTTESADGTGASMTTSADKIDAGFDTSAPLANLRDGFGASGGTSHSSWKLTAMQSLWGNPCIWIGILCLLGAAALAYFHFPVRAVVIAAAVGIGLIVIAVMPGLAFFVLAGGVLFLAWPYVVAEFKAKKGMAGLEGLRAMAAGVADFNNPKHPAYDPAIYDKVMAVVGSHADDHDLATFKAVKKADDLS